MDTISQQVWCTRLILLKHARHQLSKHTPILVFWQLVSWRFLERTFEAHISRHDWHYRDTHDSNSQKHKSTLKTHCVCWEVVSCVFLQHIVLWREFVLSLFPKTLQHSATHCNTMQHTVCLVVFVPCTNWEFVSQHELTAHVTTRILACVSGTNVQSTYFLARLTLLKNTHDTKSQNILCVAVCCIVLQCVAVCTHISGTNSQHACFSATQIKQTHTTPNLKTHTNWHLPHVQVFQLLLSTYWHSVHTHLYICIFK